MKAALPFIPELWKRLALPGEPAKVCLCPFHQDRTASFSIYQNGQRWKCFAGCGSGNAVALLAKATGLSNRDAFRKALEITAAAAYNPPLFLCQPRKNRFTVNPCFPPMPAAAITRSLPRWRVCGACPSRG